MDRGAIQVLIVEDDLAWEPLWIALLSQIDLSTQITWATSAVEAETQIERMKNNGESFDLIISDVFVSGSKTGLDLLEKYGDAIADRLLFVSGVNINRLRQLMNEKRVNVVVLPKPFKEEACIIAINAILNRRHSKPAALPEETGQFRWPL